MQSNSRLKTFQIIFLELLALGLWSFPLWLKPIIVSATEYPRKWEKIPLVKWKPYQDRPPTDAEIAAWCAEYSYAKAAAIPTGPAIGACVIEADTPEGIEWIELRGMPPTPVVRSRRGLHYYLRFPFGLNVRTCAGEIAPNVDIRGNGGMVAAAGSWHSYVDTSKPGVIRPTTFTYQWEPGCSPADLPFADPPPWLIDWLRNDAERHVSATPPALPRPYRGKVRAWGKKAFDGNIELLRCAVEGTRNDTACRVAFRLGQLCAGGELDAVEVLDALHTIAASWPNTSHTIDTINRGFKAGEEHPCSAPPRKARTTSLSLTFDSDTALGSEGLAPHDKPLGSESITLYDEPITGTA